MFTLDEVIKMFEDTWVCPSVDEANEYCEMMVARDAALHYLKMYRSDQIQWEADREDWRDKWETYIEAREIHLDAVKELKRNDLLTWQELQQMEGKPVWIEADNGQEQFKHWFIIDEFTSSDIPGLQIMWCLNFSWRFWEADIGKTWQAYRKERHESTDSN